MQRYSFVNLTWQALRGNRRWRPAWREPQLKTGYDVVVIGGGGHGLATAYYLAKKHGVRNVAVLERGWIGGGTLKLLPPGELIFLRPLVVSV
jgi:sarcosine oxidase subunit beta